MKPRSSNFPNGEAEHEPAYIHALATVVPPCSYTQTFARDRMMSLAGDARLRRLVRQVYDRSGINKRHSVVKDFLPDAQPELFCPGPDGRWDEPTTQTRNRVYIQESRRLTVEVARAALQRSAQLGPSDVTHVITASCTGFYNPGPDYDLVVGLGLPVSVERYHLGFMGCYAAFPALRMAEQFCRANPQAVVLIVCLELCSLHLQMRADLDTLLGNALFSDGAGAVVVSARPPEGTSLALRRFHSSLALEGKREMAWEIGDHGFDLVLSSYVPDIIASNILGILEEASIDLTSAPHWAVHPGGKAILDKVEGALGLESDALETSRAVLRDYGNMSSATILFVFERLLSVLKPGERLCGLAFGPGLTVELAQMELVGVPQKVSSTLPAVGVLASAG
jgi:predicted naringenin-chalcone synthase